MSLAKKRVLVVEDDFKTADIVRQYLERDGYTVLVARDGQEGLKAAMNESPDLIVLDLLLPVLSGLDVCRAVRSESAVPIIMLTALSTEQDKLAGLDLGADDYLTKPFSPRELVARIRAVLRRSAEDGTMPGSQPLRYGDLMLDAGEHTVTVGEENVSLTPTEFGILRVLINDPGRLFSRGQLVEKVMGYDYDGADRTIDVHILNLRRKIEVDHNNPEYIKTVYGMGYKLGG